jgi:hypothetical protein
LLDTTGVTEIVGTRIYPVILPTGASLPAISYSQLADPGIHAMARDPGIANPLFQVSVWSTNYAQAVDISKQVRKSLQDYSGSTWGECHRIFFETETDMANVDPQSKLVTMHIAQDYIVWWTS